MRARRLPQIIALSRGALHLSRWDGIGGIGGAAGFERAGFDRILVVCDEIEPWGDLPAREPPRDLATRSRTVHVLRSDEGWPMPRRDLDAEITWLATGKKRLVLCQHGESRSPAVAVAFLLVHERMGLGEALRVVSEGILRWEDPPLSPFDREPLASIVFFYFVEPLLRGFGLDLDR